MNPRLIVCFLFLSNWLAAAPALLINEVLASNASVYADGRNEFDDWVEIYNGGNTDVDLSGMYLANHLDGSDKLEIISSDTQSAIIPAKGFLIIWCDKDLDQGNLHADFKLDANGETLYLIDRDGSTVIDSLRFPKQYLDFSYGRIEQGKQLSYFLKPSPWIPNTGEQKIDGICAAPAFTQTGGFFIDSVRVKLTVPAGVEVLYTTDGRLPEQGVSAKYAGPILISKTAVIRARAFKAGLLPSEIVAETFFINEKITVPVVSLVMTPDDLWGEEHGIYVQPFLGMEKPGHFEYYLNNVQQVKMGLAVEIFGNTSRNSSKQSFALVAKDKFGKKNIEFPFFSDKPKVNKLDGIILRGDVTSGRGGGDRETAGERVKNELMYHLLKEAGGNVDAQAYQPVVLFINGNYWGLYNLMERKNKGFIKNNHGSDDIDILNSDNLKIKEGNRDHYTKMLEYMEHNDLVEDSAFARIEKWVDTKSLMDYWIMETYSATHDYEVNIRMWRPRTPDGKWRWLAYDEDSWGRYDEKTLHEFTSETYAESIFIIGQMLENAKFREQFINRLCDLLNTTLSAENVKRLIDEIQLAIKYEKERDYNRWKNLVHFVEPGSQITYLKEFAEKRPSYLRKEMMERFELADSTILSLDVEGPGLLELNTIKLASFPWQGVYFQHVPVTLRAIPVEKSRFSGWSDENLPQQKDVTIPIGEKTYSVKAKFE